MKKKILILTIFLTLLTCGCFKRDKMEDINIITTVYPFEYVTNRLYKDNATISSIYPKSSNINTYKFTKKQIRDFSKKDLFIYNGDNNERELAKDMLNENKNLKIIDASFGIDVSYSESDLWLNPANILMVAQNIKNELTSYITNNYIIKEIEDKYELLKIDITELETEFKTTADNSNNNKIIVTDTTLNFLKKYGFEIINLTENNKTIDKNIEEAKKLLNNKDLSYIFIPENTEINDTIKNLIEETKAEQLTFRTLSTITEKDQEENEDYISLMYQNLELIKKETYR